MKHLPDARLKIALRASASLANDHADRVLFPLSSPDLLSRLRLRTEEDDATMDRLNILHTIFVDRSRTADFQTTSGLVQIVQNDGNLDDVLAFFGERMLPLDDIQAQTLAEAVLAALPDIGYLTISNALQWRLQYSRVIKQAGSVSGIESL